MKFMKASKSKDESLGDCMLPAKFGGEELLLDCSGAMYMPQYKTLIFSDLHFEKGSYFAARGNPIPVYDTLETIQRMEQIIARYVPERVICLGDSFHDYKAELRIDPADKNRLDDLCNNIKEWVWILGNHDKHFPQNLPGITAANQKIGSLYFSHEYENIPLSVIGHYHPKLRISLHGHRISGPCFINDANLLIMPSFGAFTGGLYTDSEAISALFTGKPKKHLIYNNKIWPI